MKAQDGAIQHRRGAEGRGLVYPVFSRRSGGLSLGVNLFPQSKVCDFDCPYCEVLPTEGGPPFSLDDLRRELADFLDRSYPLSFAAEPIRDICISGNGEPSLYPRLGEAIALCAEVRRSRPGLLGHASLVLITNSSGFQVAGTSKLLHEAVAEMGLVVWAKLDGAGPQSFRRMSRSRLPFEDFVDGISRFASLSPIVLQTMLCVIDGTVPDEAEALALAGLVSKLIQGGARIAGWQLYTQARPSAGPSSPLPDSRIAELARAMRGRLASTGSPLVPRVYGRSGELFPFKDGQHT